MTRRCAICSVNYPIKVTTCLICDTKTGYFSKLKVHEDWEERVLQAREAASGAKTASAAARIAENRLTRFRLAGLDLSTALAYAAERDAEVSLHLFEKLRDQGCPMETAARIVAPLD